MAGSPSTYDSIQKIPLAVPLNPRNASLQQDAWMKNVFVEMGDEGPYSVKRPGLKSLFNLSIWGLTTLQFGGMGPYGPGNYFLAIYGKQLLYFNNAAQGFNPVLGTLAPPHSIAAQDRYRAVYQPFTGAQAFTAFQGSGSDIITYGRLGGGIAYFSTQVGASVVTSLRPSLCLLDNTWYCLDAAGRIWASGIGDISSWPILNMVQMDGAAGDPSAMWRHLSYLLVFGTTGVAAYYDAAISPGAPIAIVPNGVFRVGMPIPAALSLSTYEDTTYFLGQLPGAGYVVYSISGLQISPISSNAIARLLNAYMAPVVLDYSVLDSGARTGWPTGMAFQSAGHSFYILTFPTYTNLSSVVRPGITLAYDIGTKDWQIWTQQVGGVESEWHVGAAGQAAGVTVNGSQIFPDVSNGQVYTMDEGTYQDNGQAINVLVQTDLFNWGNQRTKLIAATYPLLDTVNSSVNLSWTDDDYQTFSQPQAIATATAKKQLVRCGSTVQRAWKITHTDNAPMRFYSLEVEVVPGAL